LAEVLARPLRYDPLRRPGSNGDGSRNARTLHRRLHRFCATVSFDDSPVVDTVQEITGRPRRFEQLARAHAESFG
jgi:hypothetical protein